MAVQGTDVVGKNVDASAAPAATTLAEDPEAEWRETARRYNAARRRRSWLADTHLGGVSRKYRL